MTMRSFLLGSAYFALCIHARTFWIDNWCNVVNIPAAAMIAEAIATAESIVEALDSGDPKMLEAFKQIFKFAYDTPGQDSVHLTTFQGKHCG